MSRRLSRLPRWQFAAGLTAGAAWARPLFQLVGSWRVHNRGAEADPDDSAYTCLVAHPGVELRFGRRKTLHADVGLPASQDVLGNQVVAPALWLSWLSAGVSEVRYL